MTTTLEVTAPICGITVAESVLSCVDELLSEEPAQLINLDFYSDVMTSTAARMFLKAAKRKPLIFRRTPNAVLDTLAWAQEEYGLG